MAGVYFEPSIEPPPSVSHGGSSSASATNSGSMVDNAVNASTIAQPPHDDNSVGLVAPDPVRAQSPPRKILRTYTSAEAQALL